MRQTMLILRLGKRRPHFTIGVEPVLRESETTLFFTQFERTEQASELYFHFFFREIPNGGFLCLEHWNCEDGFPSKISTGKTVQKIHLKSIPNFERKSFFFPNFLNLTHRSVSSFTNVNSSWWEAVLTTKSVDFMTIFAGKSSGGLQVSWTRSWGRWSWQADSNGPTCLEPLLGASSQVS